MLTKKNTSPSPSEETGAGTVPEKVSILIVDDLPEKHVVYKTILEELGQNLVFASSGQEALKQVLHHEFAVILLDVNMPDMDGFDTATLIRGRKKSAHTPIIFLTAFTDEMHAAQGYASGAVDYLPTPVMPGILKAKVRVFIELFQMRQIATAQASERFQRQAAEETARRSEFLVKVSETMAMAHTPDDVIGTLLSLSLQSLADVCIAWFYNDVPSLGRIRTLWRNGDGNPAPLHDDALAALPWLRGAIDRVALTGEHEILRDPPVHDARAETHLPALHSVLVLPLAIHDRAHGVLILGREAPSAVYTQNDVSLGRSLAIRSCVALENTMLIRRIQEADQRKDEFLATLAHELRNPLAPIKNALEIMHFIASPDPRLTSVREVIHRQVEHMSRLVDDLLDASRITKGRIDLKKESVNLLDVISHAIETSQPLIKQAGHTLITQLPDGFVSMTADATRLSQIFSNLLNNAAKYTEAGGRIYFTVTVEGESVCVKVRDTGIGIPAHMLSNIFDMFTQVDSSIERANGGLGIGLKLVKELCELHGGSVSVESAGPGQGSEFTVRLPGVNVAHSAPPSPERLAPDKGQRVLVVDDNVDSAKTLLWMLEILGHEAQLAHDGPAAIALAKSFRPHFILLDIGLPGMNGYDVCRMMREDDALRTATFIAQTGWGQAEHRQRSREAGFDHHLVKPIEMRVLQQLLNEKDDAAAVA